MAFRAESTAFFFGAGASSGFGIPTMREMTGKFTKDLEADGTPNEKALYRDILDNLQKNVGWEPDVEAIFSIIESLKDWRLELLDDTAIYAVSKTQGKVKIDYDSIKPAAFTLQSGQSSRDGIVEAIAGLESKFQKFIRHSCRVPPDKWEHIGNVFTDFFKMISKFAQTYSGHEVPYITRWKIFTTNYDTCIEYFWREIAGVPLSTGFSNANPPILQPDSFLNSQRGFELIKLHGSSNWLINKRSGAIEEKEYDIDQAEQVGAISKYNEELMIYPLSQKQLFLEPYIQMFLSLDKELAKNEFWVVVGYSFRDPIILRIFTNIMEKDKRKRLVIIDPEVDAIVNSKLSKYSDRIVRISQRFGLPDYASLHRIIQSAIQIQVK